MPHVLLLRLLHAMICVVEVGCLQEVPFSRSHKKTSRRRDVLRSDSDVAYCSGENSPIVLLAKERRARYLVSVMQEH